MPEWSEVRRARISISDEYFHYNARIIADSYPEHTRTLRQALETVVSITPTERTNRGVRRPGIEAGALNREIRESIRKHDRLGIRLECAERDGFFLSDAGTQGFDFAYIDEVFNAVAYRNRCRGPVAFHNGEEMWEREYRRHLGIHELEPNHPVYSTPRGQEVEEVRTAPIMLGEIQMGNWALLYYDLFKALAALEAASLDLYIYVCPTRRLQELVSAGTVNYRDAWQTMVEKENVLRFPIWLIGLDIKDFEA